MEIRSATNVDAAAIAHIYNQGIEDRLATLETPTRTPEERAEWLAARGPRHPVLAARSPEPLGSSFDFGLDVILTGIDVLAGRAVKE